MIRPISTALPAVLLLATWAGAQEPPLLPYGSVTPPPAPVNVVINPRTVSLVISALKSETDVPRRTRLAADLGKFNSPESVAQLKSLLEDSSPLVRAAAVRSLAMLNSADDATMKKLITDPSAAVRAAVVQAKVADAIVAGVRDSDASVRNLAVSFSLNDATDRAIAEQLASIEPPLQAQACRALAARKAAGTSNAIAQLLDSSNLVSRVAAIEALAAIGTLTRPQIEAQLSHPHSAVRIAATAGAMILPADDRLAIANKSILDKDLAVRTPAALLLGTLANEQSVAPLYAQLGAGYQPLRLSARDALITIARNNPSATVLITSSAAMLLGNAEPERKIDGSLILGVLKSKDGFEAHVQLLDDVNWRVVAQVAKSLGQIADPSVGDKLMSTLARAMDKSAASTESYDAAEQAILAATAIKHRPVLEQTKSLYMDKQSPSNARRAAVYAMGIIGAADEAYKALRPVMGRVTDPEESTDVVMEAIKGMGNAKAQAALSSLEKLAKEAPVPEYQYSAHLAADRLKGTTTPFVQPTVNQTPETSIQAVTPAAN